MLRILQVARDRNLELHPLAIRSLIQNERRAVELRGDPKAAALFMDLMCGKEPDHHRASPHPDGARWLSILNETGFLGRFIPDWARIVGQMQFDTYHVFTVDEHTIEAIRVLNTLERGELAEVAPVATSLVDHLQSRRALYLAMLLHDIAKGRGGDHSELGAEIALKVGPELGLSAEETETVSWLVLHHLLLSAVAFKRDIDDPKTILDVADTIQSPERLRLLLMLTVADMRAVSPKVWNGWKATLLRELYARVAEVLAGGLSTTERDVRVERARHAAAGAAGRLVEGGDRALHLTRLSRLLAVVRSRDPCAPRTAGARRGGAQGAADGGHPAAAGARGDRGHRLLRRPCRAVQQDLRRARGGRRVDRRCPHPHPDQRHGAGHVLDPGRRRRHVRCAAPAGAARGADRAGAVGPHPAGRGNPQDVEDVTRVGGCARSTCRRAW